MRSLHTDLYQLTMAAGFFEAGKADDRATFELFVRRLPPNREFLIAAGLAQAIEYLLNLRFTGEQIDYIRSLSQFARVRPEFFEYLREFRFTGDVFALPEGTPFFAGEPVLTLRAPLIEAQIPETYLLSTISFQSMVASKAVRVVQEAAGRPVLEFGARRAHGPEAGMLAARAAFIGGCAGTSNVESGHSYGIPVFGTAAHSWVMAFAEERESFQQLQSLLGAATTYLIDSYDTLEGARIAASLGAPLWGVRLDSGDLAELSNATRRILDDAGLHDAKIIASGDLNESRVRELVECGAPIDAFGVGTELSTSADAPSLAAVYKMVEIVEAGKKRFTAKFSEDKQTMPGAKQVFRFHDHDEVAGFWECVGCTDITGKVEALLRPMMLGGEVTGPLPTAAAARQRAVRCLANLTPHHRVEYSPDLLALRKSLQDR